MRKFTLITLLSTLPAVAFAKTGLDSKIGNVDQVLVAGTVEVPLALAASQGPQTPAVVAVRVNDAEDSLALMALDSASSIIAVTDEFVATYELKVKTGNRKLLNLEGKDAGFKVGGEVKYVDIDSLKIGDLELKGVRAVVTSSKADLRFELDGNVIGLGALPEVAWAVMPSKGVVRFASADQGDALVDSVGGTKVAYRTSPSAIFKFGKTKYYRPAFNLIVPATIDGQQTESLLVLSGKKSMASATLGLKSDIEISEGDAHSYWLPAGFGANAHSTWVQATTAFEVIGAAVNAALGADVLANYDIAVSPSSSTVALASSKTQTRIDMTDAIIADQENAFQKAEDKQAEAEKDAKPPAEGEEAPKKDVAHYIDLADAYYTFGKLDKALETYEKALTANDEDCSNWIAYGKVQVQAGKADAAVTSFEKASTQYHAWWDQDRDLLRRVNKRDKLKESKNPFAKIDLIFRRKAPEEPKQAPAACHVADGWLAAAWLAQGDAAKVEELYRTRMDLDTTLAQAWGNGALLTGDVAGAQEPLRQAMKLEREPTASWRLGLALVYAQTGDWDTAEGHFQRALEIDDSDPMAVAMWLDGERAVKGEAAAMDAAKAWSKARPDSGAAWFGVAREARVAGDDAALEAAAKGGDHVFERLVPLRPRDAELLATYALFLVTTDRVEEARAQVDKAQELKPDLAVGYLARAEVAAAKGNQGVASEARRKAAQADPLHPGFALMMSPTAAQ